MKVGDKLVLNFIPYFVEHIGRGRVTLKRGRRITLNQFRKRLTARRWSRLVSGTFLVDIKTNETISSYELLAIGVPSKRIEKLLATLPLLEAP